MDKSSKMILGFLLASAIVLGAGVALVIDIFLNVPDFASLKDKISYQIEVVDAGWFQLPQSARGTDVEKQHKSLVKRETGPKSASWVPMRDISNSMIMAVIASEDTSYFSHQGVDFHELKEALKKDLKEKSWARGGSTITQQVVKNLYLNRQKTIWRKLKEFFWAQKLDASLSKSEVLAYYLNIVEWAPNVYGVGDAAKYYFQTSPANLTAKQAVFMAMLLPAPKKYYVYAKKKEITKWAQSRMDQILNVMVKMGFIEDHVYQAALGEPLWGVTGVSKKSALSNESLPEADPEGITMPEDTGAEPAIVTEPPVESTVEPERDTQMSLDEPPPIPLED